MATKLNQLIEEPGEMPRHTITNTSGVPLSVIATNGEVITIAPGESKVVDVPHRKVSTVK